MNLSSCVGARRKTPVILMAAAWAMPAWAGNFDLGDGWTGSWSSSVSLGSAWREPRNNKEELASVEGVTGVIQTFLVDNANTQLGYGPLNPRALQPTQFTVEDVEFATAPDGKTSLAAAHAFFSGGGPLFTVELYHDSGAIPRYSVMFLGGSLALFALHLPLLDRAEKKRREFLTGGGAPPWYGPA